MPTSLAIIASRVRPEKVNPPPAETLIEMIDYGYWLSVACECGRNEVWSCVEAMRRLPRYLAAFDVELGPRLRCRCGRLGMTVSRAPPREPDPYPRRIPRKDEASESAWRLACLAEDAGLSADYVHQQFALSWRRRSKRIDDFRQAACEAFDRETERLIAEAQAEAQSRAQSADDAEDETPSRPSPGW